VKNVPVLSNKIINTFSEDYSFPKVENNKDLLNKLEVVIKANEEIVTGVASDKNFALNSIRQLNDALDEQETINASERERLENDLQTLVADKDKLRRENTGLQERNENLSKNLEDEGKSKLDAIKNQYKEVDKQINLFEKTLKSMDLMRGSFLKDSEKSDVKKCLSALINIVCVS
jgi:chromosome segregation ATPase